MTIASQDDSGGNQATRVFLDDEVERVTVDLVGDLATYQPHSKVVIFEGDGSDGFDVTIVRRLFPDFARRANLVSGGNKSRVKDLYAFLDEASSAATSLRRFFAVTDRDYDSAPTKGLGSHQFSWDRYHIENYLLNFESLRLVSNALAREARFTSEEEVRLALRQCAEELTQGLTVQLLQRDLNSKLIGLIKVKGNPDATNFAQALYPSVSASIERVANAAPELTMARIKDLGQAHLDRLTQSLESDDWICDFPGRDIMKRFVSKHLNGISYEPFVNLVLDKMVETGVEPSGMKAILGDIAASE